MHGTFKVIKADPLTLESLIAWLEKQPADQTYDWADCDGRCLIGLYSAAHGISFTTMCATDRDDGTAPYDRLTTTGIAYRRPHTFDAALKRARAALRWLGVKGNPRLGVFQGQ